MVTPTQNPRQLENSRTKILAKSFYRHLRAEGLTHNQIIELSGTLLDLVHDDLKEDALVRAAS